MCRYKGQWSRNQNYRKCHRSKTVYCLLHPQEYQSIKDIHDIQAVHRSSGTATFIKIEIGMVVVEKKIDHWRRARWHFVYLVCQFPVASTEELIWEFWSWMVHINMCFISNSIRTLFIDKTSRGNMWKAPGSNNSYSWFEGCQIASHLWCHEPCSNYGKISRFYYAVFVCYPNPQYFQGIPSEQWDEYNVILHNIYLIIDFNILL